MTDKQDQSTKDHSIALQAGGSINIINRGMQLSDIKDFVRMHIELLMPTLRKEAAEIAKNNAEALVSEFIERLKTSTNVTEEAFSKPDSQACFDRALTGSAEKGTQIDTGLLAEAVVRRLESDENQLMKLVCEESVRALTKIGPRHIAFLGFVQYTKYVFHKNYTDLSQLELTAKKISEVVKTSFDLSLPNQEYLASVGALSINRVADGDLYFTKLKNNYPFITSLRDVESDAPILFNLINAYDKTGVSMIFLTSVGKMIGMLALEKALGKVNLDVWIN
jgi:hypothetical protein